MEMPREGSTGVATRELLERFWSRIVASRVLPCTA